jgi:hypothetical protein
MSSRVKGCHNDYPFSTTALATAQFKLIDNQVHCVSITESLHKIQLDQLPILALQTNRSEVFIRPLEMNKHTYEVYGEQIQVAKGAA